MLVEMSRKSSCADIPSSGWMPFLLHNSKHSFSNSGINCARNQIVSSACFTSCQAVYLWKCDESFLQSTERIVRSSSDEHLTNGTPAWFGVPSGCLLRHTVIEAREASSRNTLANAGSSRMQRWRAEEENTALHRRRIWQLVSSSSSLSSPAHHTVLTQQCSTCVESIMAHLPEDDLPSTFDVVVDGTGN